MARPDLLALFPLEVVLFPGMSLPLHIFEPRYKRMVSDCLEQGLPFGVLLESGGERAEVGCAAAIVQVLGRYPDGRLDILTEGRDRFRVVETDEELPYLRGSVEWLAEEPEELAAERDRVLALYRRTYWGHGQGLAPSHLAGAPRLSFVVGRSNLLDLRQRQRLLETDRERDRLATLTAVLGELEPVVRRLSGNGHRRPA